MTRRGRQDKFTWLGADRLLCVGTPALFMRDWEVNTRQCPLGSNCRWSCPHTCLRVPGRLLRTAAPQHCHSLNTTSSQPVCITGIHPLGLTWCGTCRAPTEWSLIKTHSLIRVLVAKLKHSARLPWLQANQRINRVSVWCFTWLLCNWWSSIPIPPTCLAWLFSTSIAPPETPHGPAWPDYSLSLSSSVYGQENTTNKETMRISHATDVLRNPSRRFSQSPCNHPRLLKLMA